MPYDKNGKYFASTGDQLFNGTHLGTPYVNGRPYGVGENDIMRMIRRQEELRREAERKKKAEQEGEKKTSNHPPVIYPENYWLKTKELEEISKKFKEQIDGLINIRKIHEKKLRTISVFFVMLAILASYSMHLVSNPQEMGAGQWVSLLAILPLMAVIPVTILFFLQWGTTRRMKSAVKAKIKELIAEKEEARKNV